MSRTTLNFLVDAFLLVVFTSLAAISVVVRFVFPPGTQSERWTLWGHGYDAWVGLQFNILAILALGILLHLMLHWSWVCGVVANRLSKWLGRTIRIDEANQTVYGVGLLVVLFTLIGLLAAAASLQIRSEHTETPGSTRAGLIHGRIGASKWTADVYFPRGRRLLPSSSIYPAYRGHDELLEAGFRKAAR